MLLMGWDLFLGPSGGQKHTLDILSVHINIIFVSLYMCICVSGDFVMCCNFKYKYICLCTYLLTCKFFWIILIHICARFLYIAVVKYLDKKQPEEKGFILAYKFKLQSISLEKT